MAKPVSEAVYRAARAQVMTDYCKNPVLFAQELLAAAKGLKKSRARWVKYKNASKKKLARKKKK